MSNLRAIIGEELNRKKAISFARFMELALYCPDFGYYERLNSAVGRRGDFFTSVSTGGLFGELLAIRFAEWLKQLKGPDARIVEAGSHDGQLAADILGPMSRREPKVFAATEYWVLEPSPRRRDVQQNTLRHFGGKVRWFDSWDSLPASGVRGIIFSNELLDAMPVRRVGWDAGRKQWFEWGVMLDGDGFTWARLPADAEIMSEIARWQLPHELLEVLPNDFTTEIGRAAVLWWRSAAQSLKQGKLVTFDYGLEQEEFFQPKRKDGTLRAYYRHHLNPELLARAGEQDITAQVNFTGIREAGEAEGLRTEYFAPQSSFLTSIVEKMIQEKSADAEWMATQARAFQTLTHPEHLGRSFRVLAQGR